MFLDFLANGLAPPDTRSIQILMMPTSNSSHLFLPQLLPKVHLNLKPLLHQLAALLHQSRVSHIQTLPGSIELSSASHEDSVCDAALSSKIPTPTRELSRRSSFPRSVSEAGAAHAN